MASLACRAPAPCAAARRTGAKAHAPTVGPRTRVVAAADNDAGYNRATGFVAEDNSGRANIFPTKQQAYINSNTADAAARQGLGGAQGGILLGLVLGAVGFAAVFTLKSDGPETLQRVASSVDTDSLTAIAARLQESL